MCTTQSNFFKKEMKEVQLKDSIRNYCQPSNAHFLSTFFTIKKKNLFSNNKSAPFQRKLKTQSTISGPALSILSTRQEHTARVPSSFFFAARETSGHSPTVTRAFSSLQRTSRKDKRIRKIRVERPLLRTFVPLYPQLIHAYACYIGSL